MVLPSIAAIRPLKKEILVYDMYFGEQTTNTGIILIDDNATDRGIHPRWCKIYSVGPNNTDDLLPEHWILVEHGRWSRGFTFFNTTANKEMTIRRVDSNSILLKYDGDLDPSIGGYIGPIMTK